MRDSPTVPKSSFDFYLHHWLCDVRTPLSQVLLKLQISLPAMEERSVLLLTSIIVYVTENFYKVQSRYPGYSRISTYFISHLRLNTISLGRTIFIVDNTVTSEFFNEPYEST